jgi:hypothetical protein
MAKKRMVVDTANLLFRVASAHGKYGPQGTPEEKAGLAMHIALNTLNKYYKQHRPDELAVTFEGGQNWRKDFTRSAACHSQRVYKANRVKDPSMIPFFELIKSFEDLVRTHTSVVCLSHPKLEGDDLFAGYAQRFTAEGDTVVGISGDRDFVQLLKLKGFLLINPDDGKPRTCDDPEFFMYEKAFRGDPGDNVISALPRVRKDRLIRSLTDDYEFTKLMNETWTFTDPDTQVKTTYETKKLFEENQILMNLECQPDDIKQIIKETLDHELAHHGKFSHFHFTKFCGKFGLKQIAENSQAFADMFGTTGNSSLAAEKKLILSKQPVITDF